MRRVAAYVHVAGRVFAPGDQVPDELADRITNPAAWAAQDAGLGQDLSEDIAKLAGGAPLHERGGSPAPVPARTGTGSGRDAWASYAAACGIDVAEGAKRDDIIAALDEHGVPTRPEAKE